MGGQLTKEQAELPFGYLKLSAKAFENEEIQKIISSHNHLKNTKKLVTDASNIEENNNTMEYYLSGNNNNDNANNDIGNNNNNDDDYLFRHRGEITPLSSSDEDNDDRMSGYYDYNDDDEKCHIDVNEEDDEEIPEDELIPITFNDIPNLKEIIYCGFGITKLGPNIGYLYITTKLQICCDNLKEIPPEIGNMKGLTFLDLSKNKLKHIPDSIGSLDKLERLRLSFNKLKHLPASISNLIKLKALIVDNNKIEEFPQEIGQMTNLITLDVRNNSITVFPAELGKLKYLRTLLVEGCPLKSEFVHEINYSPPTLMELAARKIIKSNILNKLEGTKSRIRISNNLKDYLKSYKKCSYCSGPYFNHFVKRGKIIEKNDNNIPLEYKLCVPHWNNEQERISLLFRSVKDHDDNNNLINNNNNTFDESNNNKITLPLNNNSGDSSSGFTKKPNNPRGNNRSSTTTRGPSRISKRESSTSMLLGKSIKLNTKLRKMSNRLRNNTT